METTNQTKQKVSLLVDVLKQTSEFTKMIENSIWIIKTFGDQDKITPAHVLAWKMYYMANKMTEFQNKFVDISTSNYMDGSVNKEIKV